MSVWFLSLVTLLQAGALASFAWQRRWNDVTYWIGVMFINAALLWRAAR